MRQVAIAVATISLAPFLISPEIYIPFLSLLSGISQVHPAVSKPRALW